MKIAVIGAGYWGSKIVSTVHKLGHDCEVIDTKNGNSRLYTRFIDAMSMGLLYYLQREGVINAT